MSDPRSREDAQAEAVRRWGPRAYALAPTLQRPRHEVGKQPTVGDEGTFYGSGDSWEAAFADADRRANG